MKVIARIVALMIFSATAASAYPQGMRQYMQPVEAVLTAMSQRSPRALENAYTPDTVIIDDQAPFRWSGNSAPGDWICALTTFGKLHYARFTAFADPMQVMTSGPDSAYVTVLGTLHSLGSRGGLYQNVLMTFTLRRVGAVWKISSQSWTDIPPPFKLSSK